MGSAIGKYYNGSSNRFVNDRDTVNNAVSREVSRNADIEKTSNIGISNTKLPANPSINNSTQSNHSGNPELIKLLLLLLLLFLFSVSVKHTELNLRNIVHFA